VIMTDEPSIEEIVELTSRLRYLRSPEATQEEREAFIRDKRALLARIPGALEALSEPEVTD